jgi:hypothetical protein
MVSAKHDKVSYRQQLEAICTQLATCAERTAVRGDGLGQFAWGECGDRSVCLSWGADGIFVELWEGDTEVEEAIHPSYEVGQHVAEKWLPRAAEGD